MRDDAAQWLARIENKAEARTQLRNVQFRSKEIQTNSDEIPNM
jgi:hypothetical protein